MTAVWRVILGSLATLLFPLAAAGALALLLRAAGAQAWGPTTWVAAAPAVYLAWLLLFLVLSALEMQALARVWPKPRRLVTRPRRLGPAGAVTMLRYQRLAQVQSLPFATSMLRVPGLRELVLLSWSDTLHVGRDVLVCGTVYDPDITHLGDGVVVGGGAALSAHGVVERPDGTAVYVSAPIHVGRFATIGGEARVALGSTIGDGAVIEPGANVVAFTHVPPGETWGGNPARPIRGGASPAAPGQPSRDAALPGSPDARLEARRLVAAALGLHAGAIGEHARMEDVPGWDSLGQVVIASLVADRLGRPVASEEVFALRGVDDVARLLGGDLGSAGAPARSALPRHPELLPLLDTAEATRALLAREGAPAQRACRVVVAATWTVEPLVPALRAWSRAFGLEPLVEVAPFGGIEQALLDPRGLLAASAPGDLRVVLVRAEDLGDDDDARVARARAILDAVEGAAAAAGTIVVGTLPPPLDGAGSDTLHALRGRWRERLRGMASVEVLDVEAAVARLGTARAADAASATLARNPWSSAGNRELGVLLARCLRARHVPAAKVVALDADGTLWRGVVAEDGLDGIGVAPDGPDRAFQLLQRAVLDLRERGVLVALVSRNEPEDVWRVLDEHPGMLLRREHLAAWRVGWQPKSRLLAEIADELGLGLDAFVLLDDDEAVRREVAANAPGVVVVPLPDDPVERPAALARLWAFDGAGATDDDRARARRMGEERERHALQASAHDMASYLADLGVVVTVREAGDADLARVAQLTQKTNQFNASLRRRTVDEVRALRSGASVLVASVRDRFGELGLVGVAILVHAPRGGTAELDTFLLSCRALGRGVEETLLQVVASVAREGGARTLRAPVVEGPRNEPARAFLRGAGFEARDPATLELDLERARVETPAHVTLAR